MTAAKAERRRRLLIAEAQLEGMSRAEAEAKYPAIDFQVMDVSFDAIIDPEERAFFMNLPTSFVLDDEEVDRLREMGGRLLRQSPVYQEIVANLTLVDQESVETH